MNVDVWSSKAEGSNEKGALNENGIEAYHSYRHPGILP